MTDPFLTWSHRVVDPWLAGAIPALYAVDHRILLYILMAITVAIMGSAGRHFYTRAWSAFRHHAADMNTLIAVGTGAAFLFSVVATVAPGFFVSHGVQPD